MSQEQPPFGLPGPVLAGIQRRPDPGLSLMTPPLYYFSFLFLFLFVFHFFLLQEFHRVDTCQKQGHIFHTYISPPYSDTCQPGVKYK